MFSSIKEQIRFLSHYSIIIAHQLNLKLTLQVATAESALNDDSAVSTLEAEVTWFSDETSRLRSHSMSMRKDMNHILARIDALNEQRHFLNDQLKQVLKRSKVLEAEISNSVVQNNVRKYSKEVSLGNFNDRNNALEVHSAVANNDNWHYNDIKNEPQNENDNNNNNYNYNFSPRNSNEIPPSSANDISYHANNKNYHKSIRLRKNDSTVPQSPPKVIIKDSLISTKNLSRNQSGIDTTKKDPGSQLELLLSQRYIYFYIMLLFIEIPSVISYFE